MKTLLIILIVLAMAACSVQRGQVSDMTWSARGFHVDTVYNKADTIFVVLVEKK